MAETLEAGLTAFLKLDTNLATLIGAQQGGGIYPNETPQTVQGARVVIKLTADKPDQTVDKGATVDATAQLSLECYGGPWGPGYMTARSVADAVLKAVGPGSQPFKNFKNGLWDTVYIAGVRCDNGVDHREDAKDASGRGQQWVELSATVFYLKQT